MSTEDELKFKINNMNKEDELKFKQGNPGAVKHGNFINYYQFHPPENRIQLLPTDIWKTEEENFVSLDIGCNAGNLTITLHDFLKSSTKTSCSTLGVDIDPILIERAIEQNNSEEITFQHLDFMDVDKRTTVLNNYLGKRNKTQFDALFCFSTTMWIHLNNGDSGLKQFLNDICNASKLLIIEPQPWKCYKSALKRLKGCTEVSNEYENLKIRNNVEDEIEKIILQTGKKKIGESIRTQWGRKLLYFNSS